MDNRIDKLFAGKKKDILNIYCTAGFPKIDSTIEVMKALQENGADIIELGMPYSDPLADGPVIQESNMTALENGMNTRLLFKQLENARDRINIPIILMGYMNPVMQYGIERFCADASRVGIDAVILPDLPIYEFEKEYRQVFQNYGLHFIFLVTPETGEDRIRKIDELGGGFIYAVSSSSTTGSNKAPEVKAPYLKKLQDMNLKNPVLVGFGIRDKHSFRAACEYSNGAIIGSAYINALKNKKDIPAATKEFLNTVLG